MSAPTIETTLADIARTLAELERPYALVGGLAVSFRGEVRFTRDIDLAVVVLPNVGRIPVASQFS